MVIDHEGLMEWDYGGYHITDDAGAAFMHLFRARDTTDDAISLAS